MKAIFEEYGGIIVTVAVIAALVVIVGALLSNNGVVEGQFSTIVNEMGNKAVNAANSTGTH